MDRMLVQGDQPVDSRARLRTAVEATRLNFGLTRAEVMDLVRRAVRLGARGVCVPAQFVPDAVAGLRREEAGPLDIVTVANFPTGDHPVASVERVVVEAARAGANHVDLVVPGSMVTERDWRGIVAYIGRIRATMRAAAEGPLALKVILETAAWDPDRLRGTALSAIEAGADWLKTSTGFHPGGGASVEIVRLLRMLAPDTVGIKASGGIRTREAALDMLDAGADRIGTSAEADILS